MPLESSSQLNNSPYRPSILARPYAFTVFIFVWLWPGAQAYSRAVPDHSHYQFFMTSAGTHIDMSEHYSHGGNLDFTLGVGSADFWAKGWGSEIGLSVQSSRRYGQTPLEASSSSHQLDLAGGRHNLLHNSWRFSQGLMFGRSHMSHGRWALAQLSLEWAWMLFANPVLRADLGLGYYMSRSHQKWNSMGSGLKDQGGYVQLSFAYVKPKILWRD